MAVMKRIITILAAMTLTVGAFAIPYRSARQHVLFLTDKMAYELDLTEDQYNAVYEINLDYYLSVTTHAEIFGPYWNQRNVELQYVLSSLQYSVCMQTEYFIRPINWINNGFYFPIYDRYTRNRFFRSAPRVYGTYKGGSNSKYDHSPYQGRSYGNAPDRPVNKNPQTQQPSKSRRESIRQRAK